MRRGRGFQYVDELTGEQVRDDDALGRIAALAVPPGWTDVWVCADPYGHLQAVGTDSAGRRQYRYHDRWLERRAQEKFDQMLRFARALPKVREATERDLVRRGLRRERVLAGALRLLDLGLFRIGSEDYAQENGTFGLATMQRRHVRLERGGLVVFDYAAKGRKRQVQAVADRRVYFLVRALKERDGGGRELLAYREGDGWRDVRSGEINGYLKELAGEEFTAKDFRTWSGTVLAAVALAIVEPSKSETGRKRAISRAVGEVAGFLGNTPAVARSSYIDPRVVDRFREGETISAALDGARSKPLEDIDIRGKIERAVIDLLD